MGRRELVKFRGLRPLMRMRHARRGGRKSEKKIPPADIDGYIQGLRLPLAEQDNKHVSKPPHPKGRWETKASGVNCVPLVVSPPPPVSISDQQDDSMGLKLPEPNKESFGAQTTAFKIN